MERRRAVRLFTARRSRPAYISGKDRDRRWRQAWDARRMSQRVWSDLLKSLNRFLIEARNARERKIIGNSSPLVLSGCLYFPGLATEVAFVLDGHLRARQVELAKALVQLDRDVVRRNQLRQMDIRLFEEPTC